MEQHRQNREVDEAEFHSPLMGGVAILCVNNCGFFGSSATENLCSKCYKDAFLSKSKSSVEALQDFQMSEKEDIEETRKEDEGGSVGEASEAGGKRNPNRCGSCNKKVGLMGFNCRCGGVFCSQHRYSDKHECGFNYRQAAQEAVAKANPIVKADKVTKI